MKWLLRLTKENCNLVNKFIYHFVSTDSKAGIISDLVDPDIINSWTVIPNIEFMKKGYTEINQEEFLRIISTQLNKVDQKDITGDITGFPIGVVEKMIENQILQGNTNDITVFQRNRSADKRMGGFDFSRTEEDMGFWYDVVCLREFDVFFEKYNKMNNIIVGYKAKSAEFLEAFCRIKNYSIEKLDSNLIRIGFHFRAGSTMEDEIKNLKVEHWFEPVSEGPLKVSLNSDSGSFRLEVSKKGFYYAKDNKYLNPGEIEKVLYPTAQIAGYTFRGKVSHIDMGCKLNVPVKDIEKLFDIYKSIK